MFELPGVEHAFNLVINTNAIPQLDRSARLKLANNFHSIKQCDIAARFDLVVNYDSV
jgi:hypothetical protein